MDNLFAYDLLCVKCLSPVYAFYLPFIRYILVNVQLL